MTTNELIYATRRRITELTTDDNNITDRDIENELEIARLRLLKQTVEKGGVSKEMAEQSLGCQKLEVVDRSHCPVSAPSDCSILRTVNSIAKPYTLKGEPSIVAEPIDMLAMHYTFGRYSRAKTFGYGRFNKNMIFAFWWLDRIYLFARNCNPEFLDTIFVRGIFESPSNIGDISDCNGKCCYDRDKEFPIISDMHDSIVEMSAQRLINSFRLPVDKTNDSRGDIAQPTNG